jgi:hypothetical protein
VPDAIGELYAEPLDRFVAARDALAKDLRAKGDRDGAAAVKALRKPSRLAWALSEAGRRSPKQLRAYLDAVEATTRAQATGGPALRDRAGELRAAATALAAEASALPSFAVDRSDALTGLLATATDPSAVSDLEQGRLREVPEPSGLGPLPEGGIELAADDASIGIAARARERSHEKQVAAAEKRVARAEQRVERLLRELESARRAYDAAQDELAAAQEGLADLG